MWSRYAQTPTVGRQQRLNRLLPLNLLQRFYIQTHTWTQQIHTPQLSIS